MILFVRRAASFSLLLCVCMAFPSIIFAGKESPDPLSLEVRPISRSSSFSAEPSEACSWNRRIVAKHLQVLDAKKQMLELKQVFHSAKENYESIQIQSRFHARYLPGLCIPRSFACFDLQQVDLGNDPFVPCCLEQEDFPLSENGQKLTIPQMCAQDALVLEQRRLLYKQAATAYVAAYRHYQHAQRELLELRQQFVAQLCVG